MRSRSAKGDPLRDPLRGLNGRQRIAFENRAAKYLSTYDPREHRGWFARATARKPPGVVICERLDLQHPLKPGNIAEEHPCRDCDCDLQCRADGDPDGQTPLLCIACAYTRAKSDG